MKKSVYILATLLHPICYLVLFIIWFFLLACLSTGFFELNGWRRILGCLIGIVFACLLTALAALTLTSPKWWLFSLPVQLSAYSFVFIAMGLLMDIESASPEKAAELLLTSVCSLIPTLVIQAVGVSLRALYIRLRSKRADSSKG